MVTKKKGAQIPSSTASTGLKPLIPGNKAFNLGPMPTGALKATRSTLVTGKSGGNKSTSSKKHSDGYGHLRVTTTKGM